jgi:hypothetical protein
LLLIGNQIKKPKAMKKSILSVPASFLLKAFFALQIILFSTMAVMAQDGNGTGADVDVDINKGNDAGAWYMNWWIWVIVALVLIILIVAMTRRGGGTTVVKD